MMPLRKYAERRGNEMDESTGFHWHLHHSKLVEWCYGYEERAKYIRTRKPEHERELRLRLFKKVQGTLPDEVVEAWQAHAKARQANDKALQAYDEAWRACYKTKLADKEAVRNNMPAIEALHKEECTDCPWDGHTIFPAA